MSNLSMSMFAAKEDFLKAKADLQLQAQERVRVVATPEQTTTIRLIAGVELALRESGKHWTLSARKQA